jgi:uncharacterized protein involved in type VI secretion and phage assembly
MTNLSGVYRATITDTLDPLGLGRVQLNIPAVLGGESSAWATVLVSYGAPLTERSRMPENGDNVYVAFENGDAALPIVLGRVVEPVS